MCVIILVFKAKKLQFLWVKVNKIVFFSLLSVVFEEPEDPTNRSFFSEIISSISDVKFSNSGRYMISRDYLSVKVWDLHMETKPIETYTVSKLTSSLIVRGFFRFTGGPRLVWFFPDFKQKNLWKMKIRIEKNGNWILFTKNHSKPFKIC